MKQIPDSVAELVTDLDDTQAYVADNVTDKADSSSFEELVALQDAVRAVAGACKKALDVIDVEMIQQLEAGGRQVGSAMYARIPKRKVRFDHDNISKRVLDIAQDGAVEKETGVLDYDAMTHNVAKMLLELYVSPSTTAKTTVLDKYEIPYKEVTETERIGYQVKVLEMDPEDDE